MFNPVTFGELTVQVEGNIVIITGKRKEHKPLKFEHKTNEEAEAAAREYVETIRRTIAEGVKQLDYKE